MNDDFNGVALDFSRYQGLIFDMDGTLIDTMPAHLEAWSRTMEVFDIPCDKAWIHARGGMPSSKIVVEMNKHFSLDLDPQQVAQHKMATFSAMEDHGDCIRVTCELVRKYVGEKKLAVGTGSLRESAMKLLEKSQLLSFFDAVVTASDVTEHKPNPHTFLLAAEQLNLPSEQCAVFEDTELGLQAAHAAGMDCFMVEGETLVFHPYIK
ncbi:beta-phosphoglucomutase family hydrolase [Vibrio sp. SM6]|uniref:Beta-phosphoglucomutase family hydrolase n=1 Tax=Vibrio agarilyticus TaxID=2726741 RepID=A0A7X8TTL4_9VIBR|nr:beta-phosphoglucomutase family hydrolase [Vibrio agarilyticus]NLS14568.1 beta-phosphoglucomutase family hydrolase [Vibrio agarilyticus]